MRSRRLRLLALTICVCLLLPTLSGCAQFEAYRLFFTGAGQKDPAEGAPPPPTEALTSLTLGYDESYTVTGRFLSIEDVDTPDQLLVYVDEELETDTTFTLRAVGVGSGTLVYEWQGEEQRIPLTVQPARLSVFFLLGEGEARGTREEQPALMRAADGLVYYTFPEYTERFTPETVDDYVVEWLTENEVSKTYMPLLCKTNELTAAGRGRYAGLAAPLAYKWAEQTGDHVWVINLVQETGSIRNLLPDAVTYGGRANDHACLEAIAASVNETLVREYQAGHYVHARTGWFLSSGEQDVSMSATDYFAALEALSTAVNEALTFTLPGTGGTEEAVAPEFGGLLGSRATRTGDFTMAEMSGPRTAQMMAATAGGALEKTYLLTDLASEWYNDAAVAAYFAKYDRHKFLIYYGYQPPAGTAELVAPSGLYTAAALNETAAVAVENLLYITGHRLVPAGLAPAVSLLAYNGRETVTDYLTLSYGEDTVAAVPRISPLYLAKSSGFTLSLEADDASATVDLCRVRGLGNGDTATVRWSLAGGKETVLSLHVKRLLQFAMTDYPALVHTDENGRLIFDGFSPIFSYGYIESATGIYTDYTSIQYQYGWLYDGKNIWAGHGGVYHTNGYRFGAINGWDSVYAFHTPDSGTATISFAGIVGGRCASLFAICLNGKPVWPKAADSVVDNANFYTLTPETTLDELNAAVATLSLSLKKGDLVTFVSRKLPEGTAENAVYPVIVIE